MPRTAPSADVVRVYAVIPIAVFTRIDAGTASSSAFQRLLKIVHDHAGIAVHVRLESVFTMRWKPRSPWTGICNEVNPRDVGWSNGVQGATRGVNEEGVHYSAPFPGEGEVCKAAWAFGANNGDGGDVG
jgi:hypothetical protein